MTTNQAKPPLVVVAGATGTGKSALAIALAQRLGGEVINADSMQLYRGMDIGTAKLVVGDRLGVPHHLLDVLDVTQTASVAAYQREARRVIEQVQARGATPVLVGGSGLYLQSVVDEIEFPGTDVAIRARLLDELAADGTQPMFERLQRLDAAAAQVIEPNNGRRIVRALEVNELTGAPFTAAFPRLAEPRYGARMMCLDRDRALLDGALDMRVEGMMASGFLAEVEALESRGLRDGATASKALGYRQLLQVLDDVVDERDAVAATASATRRFSRKQRSWFRRDPRMTWLDADDPALLDRALECITRRP